jgi:hypothetical protein
MEGSSTGSCPMASFGISGVEPSGTATIGSVNSYSLADHSRYASKPSIIGRWCPPLKWSRCRNVKWNRSLILRGDTNKDLNLCSNEWHIKYNFALGVTNRGRSRNTQTVSSFIQSTNSSHFPQHRRYHISFPLIINFICS